jgi:hypothetical protein
MPSIPSGYAEEGASISIKALQRTRHTAAAPLSLGVCAVHAVMLGSESLLSRCAWSRRTREAQGRHREVGSEGSVERTCGARDTNRIRGVVQPGRAGTQPQSPPSTIGLCLINPASMHGRYDSLPREICGVSSTGLRVEESSLTAPQKSAEGIVGACKRAEGLNGREESSPAVEWRDGIRRGVGRVRRLG